MPDLHALAFLTRPLHACLDDAVGIVEQSGSIAQKRIDFSSRPLMTQPPSVHGGIVLYVFFRVWPISHPVPCLPCSLSAPSAHWILLRKSCPIKAKKSGNPVRAICIFRYQAEYFIKYNLCLSFLPKLVKNLFFFLFSLALFCAFWPHPKKFDMDKLTAVFYYVFLWWLFFSVSFFSHFKRKILVVFKDTDVVATLLLHTGATWSLLSFFTQPVMGQ